MYFEDFEVGKTYEHRYTRTVTQMDNMLFSNMTLNPQPLHIDRHFCETETEWGQPLMNSLFTLGLMIGIQVSDMTVGTTIANLGMTEVKFPIRCSRATPCIARPGRAASANRNRARAPASSNSITRPSSRTARWWPNATAAPSSRCGRNNALTSVRSRRRRAKLDKAMASGADGVIIDLEGFDRARAQGRRAQAALDFLKAPKRKTGARACWCASTASTPA